MIDKKTILISIGVLVTLLIVYFLTKNKMSNEIIKLIIKKNEGGYLSPEKAAAIGDTGGETKYGISKKAFPHLDIKNLTIEQAIDIYRKQYLSKIPVIGDLNLLYQVLDMAINAGPGVAKKLYYPGISVDEYKRRRLEFYSTLKLWNNPNVRTSWTNRVNRTV
jgi:hypothetical protein